MGYSPRGQNESDTTEENWRGRSVLIHVMGCFVNKFCMHP